MDSNTIVEINGTTWKFSNRCVCSVTCKVGFYNKTHTSSQHGNVAQAAVAAAPPARQPAEEPAANLAGAEEVIEEDTAANPDALQ